MDFKRNRSVLVALIVFGVGMTAMARDFSRYASILDRRPFAAMALVDESANDVITVEQPPAFVKDLRMCAITESPAGLQVGFVNIKSKPPQPYYLYIGDSEDGIELVDADYVKEGVLLRKGAEQFWLYMRDGAPASAPSPVKTSPARTTVPSRRRSSVGGVVRSATPRPSGSGPSGSYADRRRKRLKEMRERAAAARERSDLTVEQRLQEYQMDLIRKGLTPLPIPLTPEMDQKLVEEGFLPAEEAVVE
jgi:hypothetical protein